MTTDANLVGKGDNSQNLDSAVENAAQTVDSTTQTATEPVLVPLTGYFRKVTASRAGTAAFRHLLATVFQSYATSSEFIGQAAKENDNSVDVLHSMFSGIVAFVERTTDRRVDDVLLRDSGPLPGEASTPTPTPPLSDFAAYSGNPLGVTDVNTLQEWVLSLQNKYTALATERENTISELTEKLDLQTGRLGVEKIKVQQLEEKLSATPTAPVAAPVVKEKPAPSYGVTITLGLGRSSHFTSSVDLVVFALHEYYTVLMKQAFNSIAGGEYSNAHASFKDAETITFILLDLSMNLSDVAETNLTAAVGEPTHIQSRSGEFADFMKEYLPGVVA